MTKVLVLNISLLPTVIQFAGIQIWWFFTYAHHYKYGPEERLIQIAQRRFSVIIQCNLATWHLMKLHLKFVGKGLLMRTQ